MRRARSFIILLLFATNISSHAQLARAQVAQAQVSNEELAQIFGVLAFDSLRQSWVHQEIRWLVADSLTFRVLHSYAVERGLQLDVSHNAYPACPWSSTTAASNLPTPTGMLIELSTRVDSTGQIIASARVGCRATSDGVVRPRGGFGTGIAVAVVKQAGKWRIARVVDRWVS